MAAALVGRSVKISARGTVSGTGGVATGTVKSIAGGGTMFSGVGSSLSGFVGMV
jgi:hypothetical protein